jgi:hypothetical protein
MSSSIHPKIQVESKQDILFLMQELESSAKSIPGSQPLQKEISNVNSLTQLIVDKGYL